MYKEFVCKCLKKKTVAGSREMAQWLSVLAALAEDLDCVPRNQRLSGHREAISRHGIRKQKGK